MQIVTMTIDHALAVCRAMRPQDSACLAAAAGPGAEAVYLAVNRYRTEGPAWALADDDGAAVAVFGLEFTSAWAATAWLIATPALTGQSARKLLRLCGTVKANALDTSRPEGRHRIEAHVLSSWADARALVDRLGFTYEGTRRQAGAAGEDVDVWAITGPAKGTR